MSKKSLFYILFFIIINLYSQTKKNEIFNIAAILEKNKIYRVFENKINIRSKTSVDSEVVTQAILGEKIKILEITKVNQDLYGIKAYWYKVEFNKKEGYIWGGLLSTIDIETDFNNDGKKEILMSRCLSNDENTYSEYMAEFIHFYKLCSTDGKLLSDSPFEKKPIESNSNLEIIENTGLNPPIKILKIVWAFGDGPSYVSREELYYLKGNKFYMIAKYENSSSMYYGSVVYKILFPKDTKKENTIEIRKEEEVYSGEENPVLVSEKKELLEILTFKDNNFISTKIKK